MHAIRGIHISKRGLETRKWRQRIVKAPQKPGLTLVRGQVCLSVEYWWVPQVAG